MYPKLGAGRQNIWEHVIIRKKGRERQKGERKEERKEKEGERK